MYLTFGSHQSPTVGDMLLVDRDEENLFKIEVMTINSYRR